MDLLLNLIWFNNIDNDEVSNFVTARQKFQNKQWIREAVKVLSSLYSVICLFPIRIHSNIL